MPRFRARHLAPAALFLCGCLFETRVPHEVPLRLDDSFSRFDPLIIAFHSDVGGVPDTLYRGPGRVDGKGMRTLRIDGREDSGHVRLDGYVAGRLVYRLDLPWPEDTLVALPRWTPVGKAFANVEYDYAALGFRDGKPLVLLSTVGDDLAEFDGKAWKQVDLPAAPRKAGDTGARNYEIFPGTGEARLFHSGPYLLGVKPSGMEAEIIDTANAWSRTEYMGLAYHSGNLVVATGNGLVASNVKVRHYRAADDWSRTDERDFKDYIVPSGRETYTVPGTRIPFLAHRGGVTALLLVNTSQTPWRMRLFHRRDGAWDSSAAFPLVRTSALAIGDDGLTYMAYREEHPFPDLSFLMGPMSLRRYGGAGWEEVGPRDIFGDNGTVPLLRIHGGVPYVAARTDLKGFQVARLREGRWELLVQPQLLDFRRALDFELDTDGVPWLCVIDNAGGTRVLKYVDPHRP